jgi:hypothetical protein
VPDDCPHDQTEVVTYCQTDSSRVNAAGAALLLRITVEICRHCERRLKHIGTEVAPDPKE